MLAVHLENLLFLLLLVVAGLFQLLGRVARKGGTQEAKPAPKPAPRMPKPIPRALVESDEERIRKFLEALGHPPTSKLPSPVVPRTDVPPRPLVPVQPPISPLSQLRRLRKREVVPEEMPLPRTVSGAKGIVPPKITSAPVFEVHEGSSSIEPQAIIETPLAVYESIAKDEESQAHIGILLGSKSGLRDAIILREILGSPRGLRIYEVGT